MTSNGLSAQTTDDYQTLTSTVGLVDLGPRTQIQLDGSDRLSFLNGFCTNDLGRLRPGEGCETFLTDVKGKVLGHGYVYLNDGRITLDTVPEQAERLLSHLDRYLITEDVRLRDLTDQTSSCFLSGPDAKHLLSDWSMPLVPDSPWAHASAKVADSEISVRRVAWTQYPGFHLAGPTSGMAAVAKQLAACHVAGCGFEAFDILRIDARTPMYGRDITDENLPQEVDRDEYAISFTKGCYLGQETVARLDALGHVNRLLRKLVFDSKTPPQSAEELRIDSRAVGHVTSAAWSPSHAAPIALAYVRREQAAEGTELQTDHGTAVIA